MEGRYRSVEICRSGGLLSNLASPASAYIFSFPVLEFIGAFICEADILVEIRLDELKRFSSGLEEDVVEFRDHSSCANNLEQLPRIYWYHIYH